MIHVPHVREAIKSSPVFQSPFNPRNFTDIYSRVGVVLDITQEHITQSIVNGQKPDVIQATIDEAIRVLDSVILPVNLPWWPDVDEQPFWRQLSLNTKAQLEMFAGWASSKPVSTETLVSGDWGDTPPEEPTELAPQ